MESAEKRVKRETAKGEETVATRWSSARSCIATSTWGSGRSPATWRGAAGANPRHLSPAFRETLNITLIDYINIAAKLGFSSTQYFSIVFKQHTHVMPKEYKLMAEKGV